MNPSNFITHSGILNFFLRKWKSRQNRIRLKRMIDSLVSQDCPIKIIIGAGTTNAPGWIATDQDVLNIVRPSDWDGLFPPGSIHNLLAEHVWEHLDEDEASLALRNCHKYLRPSGVLRLAVPDGFHPNPQYIEHVRVGSQGHKVLYNHRKMTDALSDAGFEPRLLEYYDENHAFHEAEWNLDNGIIRRSRRFQEAARDDYPDYSSLIVDAVKPDR
jgi:predicted SAM-dependent methyltransferase